MKKNIFYIIAIVALSACGQEIKDQNSETKEIDATSSVEDKSQKKAGSETVLCKINGEAWSYTKGSGIVFKERNTDVKKATFTFKKKLEKGSETVQVEYDIDQQIISRILVDKKWIDLTGKLNGTMYGQVRENSDYSGNRTTSASLQLANGLGSGTASFPAENLYEKKEFDAKYHFIEITDLSFEDVGFSDLDGVSKQLKELTGQ